MRYLGGKSRIAKKLAPIILELAKGRTLIEPFCGGLSMTEQLHPVYASDASVPLISLIRAVRNGWAPPDSVSREEWAYARKLPETHPAHGFCKLGCSFGGGGRGYAKTSTRTGQNYIKNAHDVLLRNIANTRNTEFGCCSYRDWIGDARTIFYCDPPYAGVSGYKSSGSFDNESFWEWCTRQVANGAIVLVSEYTAPTAIADEIIAIASKTTIGLQFDQKGRRVVERLFRVR